VERSKQTNVSVIHAKAGGFGLQSNRLVALPRYLTRARMAE